MGSRGWVGVTLVKIATVYLVVGLLLGVGMGVAKDFSLASVHSHVALLGWTAMALSGLIYLVFPRCRASRLALAHFWLHNIGLPVMMAGLAAEVRSAAGAEPVVGIGSVLVATGLVLFTLNVLLNSSSHAAQDVADAITNAPV